VGSNGILECKFLSENAHRTSTTIMGIRGGTNPSSITGTGTSTGTIATSASAGAAWNWKVLTKVNLYP
jgi:hypothetical protein